MTIQAQGLRAWLWQRLTSVYIAVYLIVAAIWYLSSGSLTFDAWRTLMANPLVNISSALFLLAMLLHAGVGARDILVDYVHPLALRVVLLVILVVSLIALAIWSLMILSSVVAL